MRTLITKHIFILLLLIILGGVLRFFRLSDFPVQLNHDEISQFYDAISIAQTGKDIYGNFLPFIFPSVGDFKPPFYTYITSIFFMIFGWQEITIRLPAVFFGVLLIPTVYFFSNKLLNNKNIALLAAFFTSFAPFEIFFSRKSFENGAGIFLMLLGFICLFSYMEKKRFLWIYLAAGIFATAMYTYFSHAIIIPLLLITFSLIAKGYSLKDFKKYLGPVLLFLGLTLPLLVLILINSGTRFRSQTVFIKQDVNLGRELGFVNTNNLILDTLLKSKITLDYSFNRYLKQFDPLYLFGNGLDFTNYSFLGIGPLLLMQFPFLILGIIFLLKNNQLDTQKKFMGAWIILGMLPSGLTFEANSPHRVVMVFTMLNIICAAGLFWAIKLIRYYKFFYFKLGFLSLVFIFNLMYFIHMYFVNFPFEKSQYIQYPVKQVSLYAWSQYQNFDTIIFDPQFGDVAPQIGVGSQYYFAYFGHVSPFKFQKQYRIGEKPREVIFDKFSIRQVYWPDDRNLKNTLVIVSPWSVPEEDIEDKSKIVKRFNFYDGKLAFYAIKL